MEGSEHNRSLAPGGKTPKEQIDDYPIELKLPTTAATIIRANNPGLPEGKHPPQPVPNATRISTRSTKGQAPRQSILLANLLEDSKAANEPYESKSYKEALEDSMQERWVDVMQDELQSLAENETWSLVPAPNHRSVLRGKCTFELKRGAKGEITRYKARWLVRRFGQEEGLD